jgi:hypothetical protein
MAVHLHTIIEFTDEDGDGAYDIGEPVANRTSLDALDPRIKTDEANATRTVVDDLGNDSRLRLVFDFGPEHPEAVGTKLDVVVEGYDFEGPDTRVALGSRVQVNGGVERVPREGAPAIAGQQGETVSYLSWVPTVQVDGDEHPVGSSVHVEASDPAQSAIVYWGYPQGDEIVHDPTMGVQEAIRDLAGRTSTFAMALAGTLALLGMGYAARSRWRL